MLLTVLLIIWTEPTTMARAGLKDCSRKLGKTGGVTHLLWVGFPAIQEPLTQDLIPPNNKSFMAWFQLSLMILFWPCEGTKALSVGGILCWKGRSHENVPQSPIRNWETWYQLHAAKGQRNEPNGFAIWCWFWVSRKQCIHIQGCDELT